MSGTIINYNFLGKIPIWQYFPGNFIDLSTFLSENGFNSVALDLRAHGESEGQLCSFGVNEKKDIQKLIDYLPQHKGLN